MVCVCANALTARAGCVCSLISSTSHANMRIPFTNAIILLCFRYVSLALICPVVVVVCGREGVDFPVDISHPFGVVIIPLP
jgi:hypothetical protein